MGLKEVLIHTVRRAPVTTAEDSERALDVLTGLKEADDQIEMAWEDFDWMRSHVKALAFRVWAAPDAAYLGRYLDEAASSTPSTARP